MCEKHSGSFFHGYVLLCLRGGGPATGPGRRSHLAQARRAEHPGVAQEPAPRATARQAHQADGPAPILLMYI